MTNKEIKSSPCLRHGPAKIRGQHKIQYDYKKEADIRATQLNKNPNRNKEYQSYKCKECNKWHVGGIWIVNIL